MLDGALRLALAAAVATGAGLLVRALLLRHMPGMDLAAVLMRATVLCAVGVSIYLAGGSSVGCNRIR